MTTPTLAHKVYEFNKTVLSNSIDTAKQVASAVYDGVSSATTTARDAGATVVGQARSAVDRTLGQATQGAKEVAGQARAQGRAASTRIDDAVERTADRAIDAVDDHPSTGTPYESWTKDELYERARELDVEGRSTMTKPELISALRGTS